MLTAAQAECCLCDMDDDNLISNDTAAETGSNVTLLAVFLKCSEDDLSHVYSVFCVQ